MPYVDQYVTPVPRARLDAYKQMAERVGRVFREHGAIEYRESIAEDVKPGEVSSFPRSVQLKDDEVVVVTSIVFASRDRRDEINALAMQDERIADMTSMVDVPFDPQRMFFGGFEPLVWL